MKPLLLFFILTSNLCFGQFSNDICSFEKEIVSDFSLPKQYKQEITAIKKKFIRRMYADTSSYLCFGKLYAETYFEYYHRFDTTLYVYDFNYDGKKDILFFGRRCPGYESTDVTIFFREGKNYRPQELGTWIISMDLKRSSFEMTTVKYPCCSDFILQAMKYENEKGNDSIVQLTNQLFTYQECTDQFITKDTLVSLAPNKQLVISPYLSEEQKEVLTEEMDFGPIIGTTQKELELVSTNYVIVDEKMWFYVVIPVTDSFSITESWKTNNNQFGNITVVRGWICLE